MFWWLTLAFIVGYVAAVYTWQGVHTFIIGAEDKARQLRDQARAIEQKLRGA